MTSVWVDIIFVKEYACKAKQLELRAIQYYINCDVIIVHLVARAGKASVLILELRSCVTLDGIRLYLDRNGIWCFPGTSYLRRHYFITVFTSYVPLSHFLLSVVFRHLYFSSNSSTFSSHLSIHFSAPRVGSWLYIRHMRGQKGKLQIVVVRTATRGSAQWDSGCLWLALITDRQTHQTLETLVGTKKTQNWFRQKNTDWPLKLSSLAASQIKHGVM